jgi:hypothetical protein
VAGDRRRRVLDERGNTLVLVPAAMLVLLALATLSLDAATAFLGQRRLADLAAAVANDTAGALDLQAYYRDGTVTFDLARAQRRVDALVVVAGSDRSFEHVGCEVHRAGAVATAVCRARMRPILAPLWPGASDRLSLVAVESARATER